MIDCCGMLKHLMPPIAQEALADARAFHEGIVRDRQLVYWRIQLWRYLDESGYPRHDDPSVSAAWLVIFVLYPSLQASIGNGDDWTERVEAFLWEANAIEDHLAEQEALIERISESLEADSGDPP